MHLHTVVLCSQTGLHSTVSNVAERCVCVCVSKVIFFRKKREKLMFYIQCQIYNEEQMIKNIL